MTGSGADLILSQPAEQIRAMPDLVVTLLLGVLCCSIQRPRQVVFWYGFDILARGKSPTLKTLSIVSGQSVRIRNQPGFYSLHHEVAMLFRDIFGIPVVAGSKMFPGSGGDRSLGVYEQNEKGLWMSFHGCPETGESRVPAPAGRNRPTDPALLSKLTKRMQEVAEPLADGGSRIAPVSSAFNVNPDLPHHRFPPISPILHSSPSMYLSSHARSFSGSSRCRCVPRSSRSQTTTDSGISDSRDTSVSECVVTMS